MNLTPRRNDLLEIPLVAGVIAGLLGACLGSAIDLTFGWAEGRAVLMGVICGSMMWGFVYLVCLDVWRRQSMPPGKPAIADPIYHPTEAEIGNFDPNNIPIKCFDATRGDGTTHYLVNLPTDYWTFQKFAEGIRRDNKDTSFGTWAGAESAGCLWRKDEDYRQVIMWMVQKGYGMYGSQGRLVITVNGDDILEDCCHQQFPIPSPTQFSRIREIRQYPDTIK